MPDWFKAKIVVLLDCCTDNTKHFVESVSPFSWLNIEVLEKSFKGNYVSHTADNLTFLLENEKFGNFILKCDADIQDVPLNVLFLMPSYLNGKVKRVSSIIKTRSGKKWLDFLFWLSEFNFNVVTPLGEQLRGGFTMFERKTVKDVGGFDKESFSWDTAFDLKLKEKGWTTKIVKEIVVYEKRNFTVRRIVKQQFRDGKTRRKLKLGFFRTLLHSVFRGRIFVILGYLFG